MNLEPIIFLDLAPLQVKVKVGDKDFILTEASGNAAVEWKNSIMAGTRMSEGKVVGVDALADSEPLLVSKCLYYANKDGELPLTKDGTADPRQLVNVNIIRSWPQKVQKSLFKRIQEISLLTDNDEDDRDTLIEKIDELKTKLAVLDRTNDEGPVGNLQIATGGGSD